MGRGTSATGARRTAAGAAGRTTQPQRERRAAGAARTLGRGNVTLTPQQRRVVRGAIRAATQARRAARRGA